MLQGSIFIFEFFQYYAESHYRGLNYNRRQGDTNANAFSATQSIAPAATTACTIRANTAQREAKFASLPHAAMLLK